MVPTEQAEQLYKVLLNDQSCHGGSLAWSLPTQAEDGSWTPGKWHAVEGALALCKRGLHLTSDPQGWWVEGATLYLAEYDGECVRDGSDKVAARRARLLAVADWSDHGVYSEGDHVIAGNTRATLYGNARATLYDNASAVLYGNASARLSDNASAVLYGNASARLSGNATAISDRWHSDSAQVELNQMAAHVDRRGGRLVFRSADTALAPVEAGP